MTHVDVKLPESCEMAFKEWDSVCVALASGRQSLIIRKGGIEEGPGGFTPEHHVFWLYPTHVHQGQQGIKRGETGSPLLVGNDEFEIPIEYLAAVRLIGRVEQMEGLEPLDRLHVWTRETVEKRFHYRSPGLWVLGLQIYKLPSATRLAITPEFLGCKSWIPLGQGIATCGLVPVLPEFASHAAIDAIRAALISSAVS